MPDNPKPNPFFKIAAAVEAVVIIAGCAGAGWYFFLRDDTPVRDAVPASTSQQAVERTRAVIEKEEAYYRLDGKKILMHDGTYGEIFMPVFADVPPARIDTDDIVTRNGYSFYKENGRITSISGVDVSEYQGEIDWEQVKNAGFDFAFIRVGYRTYGDGDIILDERFEENLEGAAAAGIDTGVYFFSQAKNADEAIEEADAVIDAIEPFDITYPVVFDWEIIYDDSARTDKVTVDELTDSCISFCERVKSAGYTPMIYQNKGTSMFKLDLPSLTDYDFWLAKYDTKPTYYYDYAIWQYASDGIVPGISGEVDMNISFVDYSKKN
ncbi:MAG: glycoside hydrolase [Ruminococcus sp.]|nr:glycoside hydrolase [Ruminococcus sp.]